MGLLACGGSQPGPRAQGKEGFGSQGPSESSDCAGQIWGIGAEAPKLISGRQWVTVVDYDPDPDFSIVRIVTRKDGSALFVEIVKGATGSALEIAAAEAIRSWRFAPATFRGEPVCAYFMATIRWRYEGFSSS